MAAIDGGRLEALLQELRAHIDTSIHTLQQHLDSRLERSHRAMQSRISNNGATHMNNHILPVESFYGPGDNVPNQFPVRVHQFVRLKKPSGWPALIALLRFYHVAAWSTWGIEDVFSDDDDDEPSLLAPPHESLEAAVEFAPEIALQHLAICIGLDYDRIMANLEEDEKVHMARRARAKRPVSDITAPTAREEEQAEASAQEHDNKDPYKRRRTSPDKLELKSGSSSSHAVLGWDSRRSEDRTPPGKAPRVKDILAHHPQKRSASLSPTEVATQNG